MLRLGLTGGIGAGKSTATRRLAERGAVVVDADRLAREVVEPGTDGLAEVVAAFGPAVLTPEGTLDRPVLGRLVFGDERARQRLNGILHPRIARLTAERMAAAGPDAIVVHDVPLLVENGLGPNYHLVLVVHADAAERVRRLVADRGMAEDDAAARVRAQADDAARRAAADVWLDNSGTPDDLVTLVDQVWDARILPYAQNLRARRPAEPPDSGPPPDADAVERLRARILRAVGGGQEGWGEPEAGPGGRGVELVLRVPDLATADAAREPLEEAGLFRVPADGDAERVHRGADPSLGVVLHLRPGIGQ